MPVNPESQAPSRASQKTAKRRVKKARRTTSEIGALAPENASDEAIKAAALRANKKGKKKQAAAILGARGMPTGPYLSEANKETKQAARKAQRAAKARKVRRAARKAGVSTRDPFIGTRTPTKILKDRMKADRQLDKKVKAVRAKAEQDRWDDLSKVQQLLEGGVVGQFDRKASNKGRQLLYGTKNPSAAQVALAAAPVPAYKAAKVGQTILRGERALRTASRAKKAAETAKAAKTARKAERATLSAKEASRLKKAQATGKGLGKQARRRLRKTEVKAAAKRTAARSADRSVRAVTSPGAVAAASSPGKVGEQVRANAEAHLKANPLKTTETTLKALPGLFTAGASLVGSSDRGAAAKAMAEGTVDLLRPLVEGDSEEIAKAMEEDIGYPLAPLLPSKAVRVPAKVAGRAVAKPFRAASKTARARKVAKAVAKGKSLPRQPGKVRRFKQRATGSKMRGDVANTMQRQIQRGTRKGVRESKEIVGERTGRNSTREVEVSAAAVLARYGIGRKNTIKRLDDAIRSVRDEGNVVNDVEVANWIKENPSVLKDDGFWKTVSEWKTKQGPRVTSKRAQFMAQAEVAGVEIPKTPKMLRKEGRQLRNQARKATAPEAAKLRAQALDAEAKADAIQEQWQALGVGRKKSSERFAPGAVDEMVDQTRAAREADLEDPTWLSEKSAKVEPESSRASKFGLKEHASAGINRRTGNADRSLQSLLENSVIFPEVKRGTARGVRDVLQRHRLKVDGRNAFTGTEILDLHNAGKIDLRDTVAVPSRDWKTAMDNEAFDLESFYGNEIAPALRGELDKLMQQKRKGTRYVLVPREVGRELDYQLNPTTNSPIEKALRTTAGISSRIVLYSPAWAAAQVVNETSQLIADTGLRGAAGGVADMARLWKTDRQAYKALLDVSGAGAPVGTPFGHRVALQKGDYISSSRAIRGARRTALGRALLEIPNAFSNFDRYKTTRLRAVALLAKNNKEFGRFTKGLGGSMRTMDELSRELSKMSRLERQKYITGASTPKVQKLLDKHLDHLDEMLGNFEAFTRYERSIGPLAAFYPFLRMSLRWTFRAFPDKHPVKAQILYFLSQQNREQLENLIGADPDVLESAFPVLYGSDGEVEKVMPGGARFGAPASNVIVEALGDANVAGLLRMLNPAIGTAVTAGTGISPFTGKQEAVPGTTEWIENAGNALIGMFPPARAFGLNQIGGESDASKTFKELDPDRLMRSALNPFLPISAEAFKQQQILSRAFAAVSNKPEYGDLIDALMAKDDARVKELAEQVDLAEEAQKVLDKYMPQSKEEEAAVSEAGAIRNEGTKALKPDKPPSSSSSSGGWYSDSSPGGGGGGQSKGGWY